MYDYANATALSGHGLFQMIDDDDGWERWVFFRDKETLREAIRYLTKYCRLIFPWSGESASEQELKKDLLAAIRAAGIHREWQQRASNALRQTKYRRKTKEKNKVLSVYAISKDAKRQLKKMAKLNNNKTVHEMIEELIRQAASSKRLKEDPRSQEEQLFIAGEHNHTKLEGASPSPQTVQTPVPQTSSSGHLLAESRYVKDFDSTPSTADSNQLQNPDLAEETLTQCIDEMPSSRDVTFKRKRQTATIQLRRLDGALEPLDEPEQPETD